MSDAGTCDVCGLQYEEEEGYHCGEDCDCRNGKVRCFCCQESSSRIHDLEAQLATEKAVLADTVKAMQLLQTDKENGLKCIRDLQEIDAKMCVELAELKAKYAGSAG